MPRPLASAVVLALTATALSLVGPTVDAAAPAPRDVTAAKKRPHVTWDTKAINPGTKVRAHGRVQGAHRKVLLQVKVQRSWQTFGTTKSTKSGRFRVRGRLDWYGTHKVRVVAPGRHGLSRSRNIGVHPPYTPVGDRRDFHLWHGSSVRTNYRFNPCQTIRYRINAEDVGPTEVLLVKTAILQLEWATGLRFKYVGRSTVIPYNRRKRYGHGTDLVIAWATNAEVPDFVRRTADGFGGPRWISRARDTRGRQSYVTTEAGVTLSTDYWPYYAPSFVDNTRPAGGSLLLHELGHAVGLKHVSAADEMMNPSAAYRSPDGYWKGLYNEGDLNGLARVGRQQGCLRAVRGGRVAEVPVPEAPLD